MQFHNLSGLQSTLLLFRFQKLPVTSGNLQIVQSRANHWSVVLNIRCSPKIQLFDLLYSSVDSMTVELLTKLFGTGVANEMGNCLQQKAQHIVESLPLLHVSRWPASLNPLLARFSYLSVSGQVEMSQRAQWGLIIEASILSFTWSTRTALSCFSTCLHTRFSTWISAQPSSACWQKCQSAVTCQYNWGDLNKGDVIFHK